MAMETLPAAVRGRWRCLSAGEVGRFGTGLINDTFRVVGPAGTVLAQRLHPAFGPRVHEDIEAVTAWLAGQGMGTPRLVRADDGALWVEHPGDDDPASAGVYRVFTFVEGAQTWDKVARPEIARAAGALVGRWHRAVAGLDHTYRHVRPGVHDTAGHLAALAAALHEHPDHPLYPEVAALAPALLAAGRTLPDFTALPLRHSHGDLKLSNLLFDAEGRGMCLVDLDTLGRMVWPHEMGDALRSWCNPAGEDASVVTLDLARFEAAVEGYAETAGDLITAPEWSALVDGLGAICLELSSRFLGDALRERYFGWNPRRYPSRGAHNLVRARGQWALYQSVEAQRAVLTARVNEIAGL